jgi:nitrilase
MATMRVAIAQYAPVWFDLEPSLDRLETIARQAASEQANLVVFGESWLSGYPAFLDHASNVAVWDHEPTKEVFARMRSSSVVVGGPTTERLAALCAELRIGMMVGANERVAEGPGNGTLYNALLLFDESGQLVVHRRKLVPTHTERIVWGPGDGDDLASANVHGARVGGLICWEHWMPLARQAMHEAGEDVHVAVWPWGNDKHQLASRHYAFEGRCFVLAAGQILRRGDLPSELSYVGTGSDDDFVLRGGSAVIAPNGDYLVEPVFDREELVIADLDLQHRQRETMTLDVTGHYARPDVFRFEVTGKRRRRE